MPLQKTPYGQTASGQLVEQFSLCNKNGLEAKFINYGCRLTHLLLPSGGGAVDVLLGYDSLAEYEADTSYHGAFVGRYANRIKNGQFTLGGKSYQLPQNDNGNYLHGSFHSKVFRPEILGENSVSLSYTSPAGEDGFPGELWVTISYTLTEQNELVMDCRAVSDADTFINLTGHSYFNLAGAGSGTVHEHLLRLASHSFVEIDSKLCPTGRIADARGGAFDFGTEKPIGRDIDVDDPQLHIAKGYDHCFVLDKPQGGALSYAATLQEPRSGRSLTLYTSQPGVQLYTGNALPAAQKGKGGAVYSRRGGVCLETQHFPDSPNQAQFPPVLLPAGQKFHQITILKFGW